MNESDIDTGLAAGQLKLETVSLDYGQFRAVDKVSLELSRGQIGCLLGPSGCGKTSLLRAIAGFEPISSGGITIADNQVSKADHTLEPERRRVGMVFQDFALFPHLTVEKNIAFGLANYKEIDCRQRVQDMLEMVGLDGRGKHMPHELSGGQQQRVALARAMAPQPEILLLDEPFSSLDAELREKIAEEVRSLLKQNRQTAILVTHDQHEAFAMSDMIGVMEAGRLHQWDSAYQLYHNPANRFVASFIGEGSVIRAGVNEQGELLSALGELSNEKGWDRNCQYDILVRPDDLVFDADSELKFKVVGKRFRGADYYYTLELPDKQRVICITPSHIDVPLGELLPVRPDLQHLVIFAKQCDY